MQRTSFFPIFLLYVALFFPLLMPQQSKIQPSQDSKVIGHVYNKEVVLEGGQPVVRGERIASLARGIDSENPELQHMVQSGVARHLMDEFYVLKGEEVPTNLFVKSGPNPVLRTFDVNDPFGGQGIPYNFIVTKTVESWDLAFVKTTIPVVDIDTGISHNGDFGNNIKGEFNAFDKTSVAKDDNGHGTGTASQIGYIGNNGIGGAGIVWEVPLYAFKAFDSLGYGDMAQIIPCIDKARELARRLGRPVVINASWGGFCDPVLHEAIVRAGHDGVIFIAAAGNDHVDIDTDHVCPASDNAPNVITVGATGPRDFIALFSNYGKKTVHLFAPGVQIFLGAPGDKYTFENGTSFSAPQVSGTAVLWLGLENNKKFHPFTVKTAIIEAVDKVDGLKFLCLSGGRLNIFATLKNPVPNNLPPVADIGGDFLNYYTLLSTGTLHFRLKDTLSYDPYRHKVRVDTLDCGNGEVCHTDECDCNYQEKGTYTISLTVRTKSRVSLPSTGYVEVK